MELDFATTKLRRSFESREESLRVFGAAIGKKYVMAVNFIRQARTIQDLHTAPQYRFHRLQGNRASEYALTLTGNWRLIVTIPSPNVVRIEKVEDYHGR